MQAREYIENIIQISTNLPHFGNCEVTALCKDGTVWQKNVGPSSFWECINCPEENRVSDL